MILQNRPQNPIGNSCFQVNFIDDCDFTFVWVASYWFDVEARERSGATDDVFDLGLGVFAADAGRAVICAAIGFCVLNPVHHEISGGHDVFLDGFVVKDVAVYANFLAVDGFVAVDVPLALQGVVHYASEDIRGVAVDVALGSNDEEASD